MAIPSSTPLALTGDAAIDVATHGYYWQLNGSRTINWALADGFFGEFWVSPQITVATLSGVFGNISYYANVNFSYVGYYEDPSVAYLNGSNITISLDSVIINNNAIWARGYFPNAFNTFYYQGQPGDIFLNIKSLANFLPSYDPGSAGYALAIHEIGHTLGLKHPFDDGGAGRPTLEKIGLDEIDKDWLTVMAYNDDYNYNLRYWDPATPMALDVLALQYLYGPNFQTNATDSTYTLTQNGFYLTIWDAGGTDLVDLSGSSIAWDVYLPDVQLSSLVETRLGYGNPSEESSLSSPFTLYWLMGDIENLTGSVFADRLVGNYQSNILTGNGGNDVLRGDAGNDLIDGGNGTDIAVFSFAREGYSVAKLSGYVQVTDAVAFENEGTDQLTHVELYQFSDGLFDLAGLIAPTVTENGVYRFYNTDTGTHFYSASADERDTVINTLDTFLYEGPAFKAAPAPSGETATVWRFLNTDTNVHFFTISESERNSVIDNLPNYHFEGVAYEAYTQPVEDSVGLFRFYNTDSGTHFYTASEAEKAAVEASLPQFHFEGIAFYVDIV